MSDQQIKNSASKVLSGCPSSTPIPLLLIKTQLPQLKTTLKHQTLTTLKHQTLSCFERALCLLPQSFNLNALG